MVQIKFGQLKIDTMKDSSGVFTGKNFQQNFSSRIKKVEGNGQTVGDQNIFYKNRHSVKHKNDDSDETE